MNLKKNMLAELAMYFELHAFIFVLVALFL